MEFEGQSSARTLAQRLGDTAHVSGLAIRLARQTGARERLPQWLMKVAVQRGATHYRREFDPSLPSDDATVTDEEVGVALCLGESPYNLDHLRAAAQLLSSTRVDPFTLSQLALQERCEPVLLHIAGIALRYAPELQPWAFLREKLHPRHVARTDPLPHWTRLVSHTSVTAFNRPGRTDWLCCHE